MPIKWTFLMLLLAAAAVLGLCGGAAWFTPAELLSPECRLILQLRLMRLATAFLVGAGLAVSGAACQAVLRNDLAEPYLLGISGGAGIGAAAAILAGLAAVSAWAMPLGAFLGAAAALAAVLTPVRHGDYGNRVLLSGVIIGSLCGSFLMLLIHLMGDRELAGIVSWMLGDLQGRDWPLLAAAGSLIGVGALLLVLLGRAANALSLGGDLAYGFGVPPVRCGRLILALAALLGAAAVSLAGLIGFVGLIVPHIARRFTGADHRRLFAFCFVSGGTFLVLCDLLARALLPDQEIPVGIVTAFVGGPFFLWLLHRRSGV